MNEKDSLLFKKVKCFRFLRKVRDGRFIEVTKGEFDEYAYIDTNDPNLCLPCECDGSLEFLKTYYELNNRTFFGVIVGFKEVVTSAYLVVDTDCDSMCREIQKISKHPNETVKCAIVYFSDNKKRYVPVEDIEVENV